MGRYFGLQNETKRHNVSSYWKNYTPSCEEIIEIAKQLNWDLKNDKIWSGCYDTLYYWNNDPQNYEWCENDDENENKNDDKNDENKNKNENENENENENKNNNDTQEEWILFGWNENKITNSFNETYFFN
jgi:hypothetical protein